MKRVDLDSKPGHVFVNRAACLAAATFSVGALMPMVAQASFVAGEYGGAAYTLAQSTTTDPSSAPSTDSPTAQNAPRFTCEYDNGEYTVMYLPESQPGESYAWATPGDMGGGWSADRRCAEISRRLEDYRPDGLLELRTSVENGYNIVCATTEQDPLCRIVFTVPEGQDPTLTRDRVFENLAVANSGQSTDSVSTFTGNGGGYQIFESIGRDLGINLPSIPGGRNTSPRSSNINLRPFLDPADGGTGSALRSSAPVLLSPDDFR